MKAKYLIEIRYSLEDTNSISIIRRVYIYVQNCSEDCTKFFVELIIVKVTKIPRELFGKEKMAHL